MEFLIYLNKNILIYRCVSKMTKGKIFSPQKQDLPVISEAIISFCLLLTRTESLHDGTEVAWYMPLHLYRHRNFESLVMFQTKVYECQQLT